jgi:hypothetical protein
MAALLPLGQDWCDDRSGTHFVVTRVNHDGGSNTLDLPGGLVSAAHLVSSTSGTAATVTVTQGNDPATEVAGGTQSLVTIVGGDTGEIHIVSRHVGNASAI